MIRSSHQLCSFKTSIYLMKNGSMRNLAKRSPHLSRIFAFYLFLTAVLPLFSTVKNEKTLHFSEIGDEPVSFSADIDSSNSFTWRFPENADGYILPISGGIAVQTSDQNSIKWLQKGSPWPLLELPFFGIRYGKQ